MVSIVIPAYNVEKYLQATIDSALSQTIKDKEIIIVDDGSTDGTLELASKYKNTAIKLISQPNRGASAARNTGFRASKGDYIQFLDADDILEPSKISQQLKLVATHGDDVIYSGRWGLFYGSESTALFDANELWNNFENPIDWLVTAWSKMKWMHPSAWLTSRKLIESAGLWDESLSLHDDGEFFCRVLLKSKGIIFCSEAVSYYRKGIEGSLSSIITERAVASHFKICGLYESHLLSSENSVRTRRACAANYLAFHYEHFPRHKSLRSLAVNSSKRLGGTDIQPSGTLLFFMVRRLLGWKLARRIERFYYSNISNSSALKKLFCQKLVPLWW